MKKIIAYSLILFLSVGLNAQDNNQQNVLQRGLEELLNWFPGEYDNHQQVKPEYNWLQSGRVELFYGGKIANEVIWEDFEVNEVLPDSLFVLGK